MRGKRKDRRAEVQEDGADGIVVKAVPVKPTKTPKPLRMLKRIMGHPDFGYQCMVILLSLTQESFQMDRRIDSMSSTIEKLRSIAGVMTNATQSLKMAAEAPRQIRSMFKPGG